MSRQETQVNSMGPRRTQIDDEEAQVGIGTMIVFIATVLVAAIAAGVLISTSSDLQEKSTRTGKEATEQVSSNINVESVVGSRAATTNDLQDLDLFVVLAPGASNIDVSQLQIQLSDGSTLVTLSFNAAAASATEFDATAIRDADSSFSDANPVMTSGDLVRIDIDADAALGAEIPTRSDVSITIIPEAGNSVPVGFRTPNSYGTRLVMELL